MKVLFISTRYHPYEVGGAEVTARLLAEGLVRAGGDAAVVTLAPDGIASQRIIDGVRVYYVPLFNVFFPHGPESHSAWRRALWQVIETWNPVMAQRVDRIAAAERPDLIHVHNLLGFTGAIWAALARRAPILQTLHDHYVSCANSLMYRPRTNNCANRCLRCKVFCAPRLWSSRHVEAVTTVSVRLWTRISASGAFPRRRLRRVIHNCNALPPCTGPRLGPAPGAKLRLGYLGRLEPIKGPRILLEAARRIGSGRAHVRLGGVGTPEYEAELKATFGPDLATFLGRVTPIAFFEDVDVLVAPSLVEEASGRVVHESFGFGVPVIGVSVGGMAELIEPGRTGYLVPAGDTNALETVLRRILETPPDWEALSRACLQAARGFAFERIFDEYRLAWNETIASRATRASKRGGRVPHASLASSPSDV